MSCTLESDWLCLWTWKAKVLPQDCAALKSKSAMYQQFVECFHHHVVCFLA